MEKLKNFFKTNKHLLILIGEVILVVAIATVFLVIVGGSTPVIAPINNSSNVSSSNDSQIDSGSLNVSSEISSSSIPSSIISSNVSNNDTSINTSNTSSTVTPTYKTWSDDQFLPTLNTPYPVLDYIYKANMLPGEELMFTSLEGIVNKKQPRIYMMSDDPAANVPSWITTLKLKFNKVPDPYSLIAKYKSEIKGIIIYDDSNATVADTINLATTMAGAENGIIVSPNLVAAIQAQFNFPVIKDLRGMFTNKWDIYNYQYDNYASRTTNRVIVGLTPATMGCVRDYAIAIGANVIDLNPNARKDSPILDKFFDRMPSGKSTFMGWWSSEGDGVSYASARGVPTVASDYSSNLSVYSGMKPTITPQAKPKVIPLQNKIYVAMIVSDGDNMQYMQGRLPQCWDTSDRGQVPLSWTISPACIDLAPAMLDYYLKTATANDCLIDGPSAFGYLYPNLWKDKASFPDFIKRSNNYMSRIGLLTSTTWNRGEMTPEFTQMYADNMTAFLGITQQDGMANGPTMVKNKNNKDFLSMSLNSPYDSEIYQMEEQSSLMKNFDGTKPIFISIQGISWGILGKISTYVEIADYYKMTNPNVEFVRLDQLMMLQSAYLKS
jgi:hypothetical protein